MPRIGDMLSVAALVVLLLLRISLVDSIWGAFEQTVHECEYDLDQAACFFCAGVRVGLDWRPLQPSCNMCRSSWPATGSVAPARSAT